MSPPTQQALASRPQPLDRTRRYAVILNARAGSAGGVETETLAELFAAHGHEAVIDDRHDLPLDERIKAATAQGAQVIVAAGGDGTATAVAQAIAGTDKILAVLPLGTANLLARDLQLPLVLDKWIADLGSMEARQIDAGEVNGRLFLHKVVIGAVIATAAAREKIRGKADVAAIFGLLGHFVRRMSRVDRFAVEITPRGGEPRVEIVEAIAVANNDYDEGIGRFFSRSCLDGGSLSLYVMRHLGLVEVFRFTAEMFMGAWRQDAAIEIENVDAVTIRTRRRLLRTMIDGEIQMLETPLRFRIRPLALTVLAPVQEAAADETGAVATVAEG